MKRVHVIWSTLGAAAAVVALSIVSPRFITSLDLRAYDELLRREPRPPLTGRVSIVAVDEKSIAEIGQWPWRRDVLARLVDRLHELGAGVVALDVILSEPDRFDKAQTPTDNRSATTSTVTDGQLAAALDRQRAVTGYAFTFDEAGATRNCVLHPLEVVQVA